MQTKTCTKCKETKTIDCFGRQAKGKYGVTSECKPCYYERCQKWRAANPEKWRVAKNAAQRAYAYRSKYGLKNGEYKEMLELQKGLCLICRTKCATGNRLCVDHDHRTGKVRGLLCQACNTGIGKLQDDRLIVLRAADYLDGKITV